MCIIIVGNLNIVSPFAAIPPADERASAGQPGIAVAKQAAVAWWLLEMHKRIIVRDAAACDASHDPVSAVRARCKTT